MVSSITVKNQKMTLEKEITELEEIQINFRISYLLSYHESPADIFALMFLFLHYVLIFSIMFQSDTITIFTAKSYWMFLICVHNFGSQNVPEISKL